MLKSLCLARLLAAMMFVPGVLIWIAPDAAATVLHTLADTPQLLMVAGLVWLALAMVILTSDPVIGWDLRTVVTLVGVSMLVRSLVILFAPEFVRAGVAAFTANHTRMFAGASTDILLGIVLGWLGFLSHRGPLPPAHAQRFRPF
jgi:hypothetical protein